MILSFYRCDLLAVRVSKSVAGVLDKPKDESRGFHRQDYFLAQLFHLATAAVEAMFLR